MVRTTTEHRTEEIRKAAAKASDIRVGVLTTVDAIGRLVSRPMARQEVGPDGDLWFLAERDSREVAHIASIPEVSVTLTSKDTKVSIHGLAAVVDDPAKARDLSDGWVGTWPHQGRDVVLVKVTAMSADCWDDPAGR